MDPKDLKFISKNKYKIKPNKKTMKEYCMPKKFKLQPSQKFLGDFFKRSKTKGILIYHKIGSGKTCTAINIAEQLKNKLQILIVLPASLIGNFRNELRTECPGDEYISSKNRKKLLKLSPKDCTFQKIIKRSDNKINKFYKILSYHKFVSQVKDNKIKLKNTLLIIDEVQNMISEDGTFYKSLKSTIDKSDDKTRIILLSATPIFDKPVELSLTLNLLKLEKPIEIGAYFNKKYLQIKRNKQGIYYKAKNLDKFKQHLTGIISYYRGAPPQTFPRQNLKVVRCYMSDFQYKSYITSMSSEENFIRGSFRNVDILKLPNNFFIGPRILSNISFPNKGIGMSGFMSLKKDALMIQNIKEYSTKFYNIYQKIKQSIGPIFVYSNFKDIGGIKSLVTFFEYHGFKNYKTYGQGEKRYAIWSGDEHHIVKEEIKHVFNQKDNHNGSKIKIIFGSPAIKEGVSLLRVEQVHILEPYWNFSRIDQIMGRAIRFCSHKDLSNKRQFVDIFLYLAVYYSNKPPTIDDYIWKLAKKKQRLIKQFEDVLKEKAIDCELFYEGNNYKDDEEQIECDI
jgi:superfamily II DNA or RNA helicase